MMKTSLTGLGVGKVVSASPAGKPDAAQHTRKIYTHTTAKSVYLIEG